MTLDAWLQQRRPIGPALAALAVFLLALAPGLYPGPAHSMWAALSDDELERRSELVVQGRWAGTATAGVAPGQAPVEFGVILVDDVLRGPAGLKVVLVRQRTVGAPRSSTDLTFEPGVRGLWFLRAGASGPEGDYLLDHPQRFIRDAPPAVVNTWRQRLQKR